MALFGNKEDKEVKRQQKEQEQQQRIEARAQEKYEKHRAKLKEHGLGDLDDEYMQACLNIFMGRMGTGLMEAGAHLKTEDQLTINYLSTIMDQNWIMIRELNRIIKILENRSTQ